MPERRDRQSIWPEMEPTSGFPDGSRRADKVSVRSRSARFSNQLIANRDGRYSSDSQTSFDVYLMPCLRHGSGEATRAFAADACDGRAILSIEANQVASVLRLGKRDCTLRIARALPDGPS